MRTSTYNISWIVSQSIYFFIPEVKLPDLFGEVLAFLHELWTEDNATFFFFIVKFTLIPLLLYFGWIFIAELCHYVTCFHNLFIVVYRFPKHYYFWQQTMWEVFLSVLIFFYSGSHFLNRWRHISFLILEYGRLNSFI